MSRSLAGIFKKIATQNDSDEKASYVVANVIAKKSKLFTYGEFIEDIICPG